MSLTGKAIGLVTAAVFYKGYDLVSNAVLSSEFMTSYYRGEYTGRGEATIKGCIAVGMPRDLAKIVLDYVPKPTDEEIAQQQTRENVSVF